MEKNQRSVDKTAETQVLLASVRTFTDKIICKHGKKGQAMAYAII